MRTIFIGDVHGTREELAELLAIIQPFPGRDRVIFVGDLVDKGPDSLGVLRDVQRLLRTIPGSVVVAGNHEEKALRFYKSGKLDKLIDGHADREWARYASDKDWAFIETMPLTWYDPDLDIRVIHGGIFPALLRKHPDVFSKIAARGDRWHKGGGKVMNRARRMLRVRYVDQETGEMLALGENKPNDPFWAETYDGSAGRIVFGHSPWLDGQVRKFGPGYDYTAIGIDTAAVFGGKLTAYVVDPPNADTFVSVDAKQNYAEPLQED